MRLHFPNMTRPRLVAKALRNALAAHGHPYPLMRCQEMVSRMFGYASWSELVSLHANGPAVVDDAYATSHAGYRRQHYISTLCKADIPRADAETIIDTVRPTDRTRGPVVPDDFPLLLVEAFEIDEQGRPIRSFGRQDLTRLVVDRMTPYRGGPARPFPDNVPTSMFYDAMDGEARARCYGGNVSLPDFRSSLDAFIARIGGLDAFDAFKNRLNKIRSHQFAIEKAAADLAQVSAAEFSKDFSRLDFVYLSHGDTYLSDFDDAYSDWEWDTYVAGHPRPRFDDPSLTAWNEAYAAFVRETAPPFVYATTPTPWRGVDAADIRTGVDEDEGNYDVSNLLSSEMDEHYEDAYNDIVDVDVLQEIADAWQKTPKRRRNVAELERRVAAWNARQSIVSYYSDNRTILPAFPGKTKEDAVAWCKSNLANKISEFAALHVWQAPAPQPNEPEEQPAP